MRVLIAEDDFLLAELLQEALEEQGHDVCGVARNVRDAVSMIRRCGPDVVVLDMQLGNNEFGTDIVDQLMASGDLGKTGVLYVTGEAEQVYQAASFGHACLNKPYSLAALDAALQIVRDIARNHAVVHVLPLGMQLLPSG